MKPRVKVCGLRRVEDAELAVRLGASHVGCVRAPTSPRQASLEEAGAVFGAVSERAETVLVFKDVPLETVIEEAERTRASAVQLYDATEREARLLEARGLRVYRVYRMDPGSRLLPRFDPAPTEASPAVLDVGGGGSGRRFDWSLFQGRAPRATIIAGGVRPDNIGELMSHRPYGVDLSSGVESAPGIKDGESLRRFFERLARAVAEVGSWQRR